MENQFILGIRLSLYFGIFVGISIGLLIKTIIDCLLTKIRNLFKK